MNNMPQYQDILEAAHRLEGIAAKTPLIENPVLNELTGARVFLKAENLQITGSFKFRGAMNAVSLLDKQQLAKGIVACSSGNHAQGIAEAAKLASAQATIVMPADTPQIKIERTRRSGASIVTYSRQSEDRERIATKICDDTGATFIHPFNNANVIAGQGTVGLELAEQLYASGHDLDHILVPTGGGGLICGVAMAVSQKFANARIHSIEPVQFDDYRRSLECGARVENEHGSGSICDALLSESPGEIGFELNKNVLADGLVVDDEQVLAAIKFAFHELKLVVEPGGAVGLAVLLGSQRIWSGKTVACVLSGGNIDPLMMQRAL